MRLPEDRPDDRSSRAIRRMARGTLGGRSASAQPVQARPMYRDIQSAFGTAFAIQDPDVQAIPTNTFTMVNFASVEFDTATFWDASAPSRLTVPSDGYYLIGGSWEIDNLADQKPQLTFFYLNGSVMQGRARMTASGSSSDVAPFNARPALLSAGDYVEMAAWHQHGSDRDCRLAVFWIIRLG